MTRKRRGKENPIFRYWIEIKDLRDDSVKTLPIQFFKRTSLERRFVRIQSFIQSCRKMARQRRRLRGVT